MAKRRTWYSGRHSLWYVFGTRNAIWLGTASFTKRGALQNWQDQQPDGGKPWRWWYRNGFRCRRANIQYAYVDR